MPEVLWLTAFLDLPADDAEAGAAFWAAATGTTVSPWRGPHGEFASLLPDDADPCWRVQRILTSTSGIHLDLHVTDRAAAEEELRGLGAALVDRTPHVTVLRSPGGLLLCLVEGVLDRLPEPVRHADHVAAMGQVCLDVPGPAYDAEVAFWGAAIGTEVVADGGGREEFVSLRRPAHLPLRLLLQRVGHGGAVTAHPDIASSDRDAEVARLVSLGAEIAVRDDPWTVLRAPDGRPVCVTQRDPRLPV